MTRMGSRLEKQVSCGKRRREDGRGVFRRCGPAGLPLFAARLPQKTVFYTPGKLVVMPPMTDSRMAAVLPDMEPAAAAALENYRRKIAAPYRPECLTLYLSYRCNLRCRYCFSVARPSSAPPYPKRTRVLPVIDLKAVAAAARVVARHCRDKKKKMTLVVHGGGEPTRHFETLRRIDELIQQTADEFGLGRFSYVATNGVISVAAAEWLARKFDLIGLSCDGPPDIHDAQRPFVDGGASSTWIERTARVIRRKKGRFAVRATITPRSAAEQERIVDYLRLQLGAEDIHFEPVYRAGRSGFKAGQAAWFVRHFLAAQKKARELGCRLTFAGVRLHEPHGPFCNILKDVLLLTPSGDASACFLHGDSQTASDPGADALIGRGAGDGGGFFLDEKKIAGLKRRLADIPAACGECINMLHCARNCPEACLLTVAPKADDFRCRAQRLIAEAWILEIAEPLAPGFKRDKESM